MNVNNLDLSFAQSIPLLIGEWTQLHIYLVGCGGTGSAVALHIARLMKVLQSSGRTCRVTFIDPDIVEPQNIPRQYFSQAECGMPKALALSQRLNLAWGLDIEAVVEPFDNQWINWHPHTISILVGCVDNAWARRQLSETLDKNLNYPKPRIWWLDAGNEEYSGQVLLGSHNDPEALSKLTLESQYYCTALPSPSRQHPELLEIPRLVTSAPESCAEMAIANSQSLLVNSRAAIEVADYLSRLIFGGLRRYATYFDLASGTARSQYILPHSFSSL